MALRRLGNLQVAVHKLIFIPPERNTDRCHLSFIESNQEKAPNRQRVYIIQTCMLTTNVILFAIVFF
jgi:hypothetical protein